MTKLEVGVRDDGLRAVIFIEKDGGYWHGRIETIEGTTLQTFKYVASSSSFWATFKMRWRLNTFTRNWKLVK